MKQNKRTKKMYYDLFYPYHPILGLQNGTHTFSIKEKFKRKNENPHHFRLYLVPYLVWYHIVWPNRVIRSHKKSLRFGSVLFYVAFFLIRSI